MANTCHQRDLFESPPTSRRIPIDTQQEILGLLKELLTEALTSGSADTDDGATEVRGD
jgi:hypothetical protein